MWRAGPEIVWSGDPLIYILWGNKNPWQFWSQKPAPFLCPELCRIAAFYSKAHCSARKHAHYYGRDRTGTQFTMAGTAPGHSSLWPGPHRDRADTLIILPGPHWDALYYGRDRTGTQFTVAGTAPGHSLLLWPGPHRDRADTLITMAGTALRCSLLWPGPHRDADCYGRDRHTVWTLQSNLKGVGGWMASSTFASFCLSSCHKAITLYLKPAPKRCFTTHFVCIRFRAFCKCSDDARHLPQTRYASNLDGAHFQFPCAWRACPHMLNANPGLESLILWHGHLPTFWR